MGKPKVRDQRSTNVLILRARQGCGSQAVMWNVGTRVRIEACSLAAAEAGFKLGTRTQELGERSLVKQGGC